MVTFYRCVLCSKEHANTQPHHCTCGSDTFTPITLPDLVERGEDQTDDIVGVTWSTEKPLQMVDDKPPGTCKQKDCRQLATHRFTWPGDTERLACEAHALTAQRIAGAMGFELQLLVL